MKTSNKLLTGFLVILILVPICLLMAFRSLIRNGKYTIHTFNELYHINTNQVNKSIHTYKFIKITGPGIFNDYNSSSSLKCIIKSSTTPHYTYSWNPDNRDSLKITEVADTLFMAYIPSASDKEYLSHHMQLNDREITLYLPTLENIQISNATVILDTVQFNSQANISLANHAILRIGYPQDNAVTNLQDLGDVLNGNDGGNVADLDSANSKDAYLQNFDNLTIQSKSSNIVLSKTAGFKNLTLQLADHSRMTIENDLNATQLFGVIGTNSIINAKAKAIKKLSGLQLN